MKSTKERIRRLFMVTNVIFIAIGFMMIFIGMSAYAYPSGFISDFNTFFNSNIKMELEKDTYPKRRPPRSLLDNCDRVKRPTAGFMKRRLFQYKDDVGWRMDEDGIYPPMSYNMYWQSDFESQDQVADRFPKLNTLLSIEFGGALYTTLDYWKIAESVNLSNRSTVFEVKENVTNNKKSTNEDHNITPQNEELAPLKTFPVTIKSKSKRMKVYTTEKNSVTIQNIRSNFSLLSCTIKVLKLEDASSIFWTYVIVSGALIVFVSVEGLLAAASLSSLHRVAYVVTLTVLLFVAFCFMINVLLKLTYLKHNTEEYLVSLLRETYDLNNTVETVIWNALMIYLDCCGVTGYADFKGTTWKKNHTQELYPIVCCSGINITGNIVRVPGNCSLSKQQWAKKNGCADELKASIQEHGILIAFLTILLLVFLALAFYNAMDDL